MQTRTKRRTLGRRGCIGSTEAPILKFRFRDASLTGLTEFTGLVCEVIWQEYIGTLPREHLRSLGYIE
jgi:hypothetical protein